MTHPKASLIVSLCFLFIGNTCNAVMCARLKSVSGGENHTLALADDNTLWACGSGPLGLGSNAGNVYSLQQVRDENGAGYLKNIVAFDAGWYHSLAADANGTVWAWGQDGAGQLGNGPGNNTFYFPTKVHGLNNVGYLGNIVYVSAGRSGTHSLAVDSNGYAYAWGNNDNGQCGDGNSGSGVYDEVPVLVLGDNPQIAGQHLGDIAHIIQVDAGANHSIALDSNGHVWHWGSGSSTGTYPEKVKASGTFGGQQLSNIVQISSCYHSVAVDGNGNVWEWTSSDSAYKIPGGQMGTAYLENIAEVGGGNGYSMARTKDGYVLVWNIGQYASPEYVPAGDMDTQSGLLEGIISIAAGYYDHKLAVDRNGYGWAWGSNNEDGRFGVGDTSSHPTPTQMLCAEVSNSIYLTKTAQIQGSEPNCVHPFDGNNYLVYEIYYGNPITNPADLNYYGNVYGVSIVDHLPIEVNYSPSAGWVYDANTNTVKWTIGTLAPGNSGRLTLTTTANKYAQPGGQISNFVEMTADKYYSTATDTVPVCYWDGRIIYVDHKANGYKNGTTWNDAYTDFNEALVEAAGLGNCEIWIAGGTYNPTYESDDYYDATFQIPAGSIAIRGHFGGVGVYETSPDQRDFNNAAYETIVDGNLAPGQNASYVVTCDDIGDGLLLDGLTITGADNRGLYINNYSDPSIIKCKFTGNGFYGIYASNYSYPEVNDCLFLENVYSGIYSDHSAWPYVKNSTFDGNNNNSYGMSCSYSQMLVEDCIIKRQSSSGMTFTNSNITLNRCEIEDNGSDGINCSSCPQVEITDCNLTNNTNDGLYCGSSNLETTGCTIQRNGNKGIEVTSASVPTISNNIIHNNAHYGIYTDNCENITIKSNLIYNNGYGYLSSNGTGLYLRYSISPPYIRNNTIVGNAPYGIYVYYGFDPCLTNDIIYNNGSGTSQNIYSLRGLSGVSASYCCIGGGFSGVGNISCDPCFRNPDTNDYHLKNDSNCIDAGDPCADYTGETDIDGQCRVMLGKSDTRIDIGADEFSPKADYNGDLIVNFVDFANLASRWRQNNPNISLDGDNDVDIYDLAQFCDDWLWVAPCSEMYQSLMGQSENNLNMSAESETPASTNGTDVSNVSEGSATTASITTEQATVEVPVDNQQQSMLAGEGETAGIWLVYDGNMMPASGDEVTVYIHSDPVLFAMQITVAVAGDANITTAMSEADCNNYGWDNGWNSDPYIDPNGWFSDCYVSWDAVANGTVGYLKFRYYDGEINVSITEDSVAFDANCETVLFSGQPLIFGRDPNE